MVIPNVSNLLKKTGNSFVRKLFFKSAKISLRAPDETKKPIPLLW